MIKISAKGAFLAARHTSDWMGFRSNLSAVLIEPAPQGALLIGTNGHHLAVYHDKEAECKKPALVTIGKQAQMACKKRNAEWLTVNTKSQRLIVIDDEQQEMYVQPGKCMQEDIKAYPKWQAVAKGFKHGSVDAFPVGAMYLEHFHQTIKPWGSVGASMHFNDKHKTVVLSADSIPELRVFLMPMNLTIPAAIPDFLRNAIKEQAQ